MPQPNGVVRQEMHSFPRMTQTNTTQSYKEVITKANRMIFLIFCTIFICLMPQAGQSCTSFCLDHADQLVFAKNFDWHVGNALLMFNKRNVSKMALISKSGGQIPAKWTSRYGSITFNQVGREIPLGGMNEAGLAIEILLFKKGQYPAPDSRPAIHKLQWIQYQLDNFSTVEEVINSDSQLRIIQPKSGSVSHYIAYDRRGDCAIIEFIGGKIVYHTRETMPVKVITNTDAYAESIEYLKKHDGFGGKLPIPVGSDSLHRFVRTANMLRNYDPQTLKSAVDYAFDILFNVKQYHTLWNIIYDIKNFRIYFRTSVNYQIRYLDLKSFDFSCTKPVKVLDINNGLSGDVTNKFLDYTKEINRNLVEKLKDSYNAPAEEIEAISLYPESTFCTE
jgi:penicillin V acylase-like amidase (Ntn superfamily)